MTTHLCIHGEVFTKTQNIVDWIASRTGWAIVSDHDLIGEASQRFNMPADRLERFLMKPDGVLNRLIHGTQRAMAYVQSVLVDKLGKETTILHGSLGLPTTNGLPQVLNVLVTAEPRFRVQRARRAKPITERKARTIIHRQDRREFQWCRYAFGPERFDAEAYDLVIPSDRLDTEPAGRLILEQLMRTEMRQCDNALNLLSDLKLAATIQVALSDGGYHVSAAARNGRVRLTVDRPVLLLNRLAKKLERQVLQIKGVEQVETRAGRYFFQADIYRRCRFELPTEEAFYSFTRCRRRLHDSAADHYPSLSERPARQDQINAVQHLASTASP
jgi:two-component system response regulator CpxR